jgi:hypothetical protein
MRFIPNGQKTVEITEKKSNNKYLVASIGYALTSHGAEKIEKEPQEMYESRIRSLLTEAFKVSKRGNHKAVNKQVERILTSFDTIPSRLVEAILFSFVAIAAKSNHADLLRNVLSKKKNISSVIKSHFQETLRRLNGEIPFKDRAKVLEDQKRQLLNYLLELRSNR